MRYCFRRSSSTSSADTSDDEVACDTNRTAKLNQGKDPQSPALRASSHLKRTVNLSRTMNLDSESDFSHSESDEQSPLHRVSSSNDGYEGSGSPPARPIEGRRLSLSPAVNPNSHNDDAGGDCDSSVGINGSSDISPAVETQVETWRNSAAAAEDAGNQMHSKEKDILEEGAGVRFVWFPA